MVLTPAAALRDVDRATKVRQRAGVDVTVALARQAKAIRAALAAGALVEDVAVVARLSVSRVYQIKDGH